MKNEINNNYQKILGQINKACKNSNRDPKSIKLIAICKRQPMFKINQAIEDLNAGSVFRPLIEMDH